MLRVFALCFLLFSVKSVQAQGCCSGGAGSPIAGGAATGVLQKNQMEISANYQFDQSNRFLTGTQDTLPLFDNLTSKYLFLRVDYGLSEKLTMSVASGYYLNRSLVELEGDHAISSRGIGDLIVLPRYNVYSQSKCNTKTELTLGLGMKIPLGTHTDSNLVFSHPVVGDIYTPSPPSVQTTNGSLDMMFYSFFYRAYKSQKLRFFANSIYMRKGYNSSGQKFGDYASIGLFAGKTIFNKIGVTVQVKGEWVGRIQSVKGVDLLAEYNIDKKSTGSRKVFFIPQLSYTHQSLTAFVTSETPLYQNLNGTQVGSQYRFSGGLIYRFNVGKKKAEPVEINPAATPVIN